VEIGRIKVPARLGKKFKKPPFQPMPEHGSLLLPFQLHREVQIGGLQPRQKGLEEWLK
jgi:hypothetical protein